MFKSAKRSVAGWLGDKAQELLGGGGKEGEAPTSTGPVSEVTNQTYAHGGFMGAAGAFMKDPKWSGDLPHVDAGGVREGGEDRRAGEAAARAREQPGARGLRVGAAPEEVAAAGPGASSRTPRIARCRSSGTCGSRRTPSRSPTWRTSRSRTATSGTTVAQGVGGEDPVGYTRDDVKHSPHAGEWMDAVRAGGRALPRRAGRRRADAKNRDEQLKQLKPGPTARGDGDREGVHRADRRADPRRQVDLLDAGGHRDVREVPQGPGHQRLRRRHVQARAARGAGRRHAQGHVLPRHQRHGEQGGLARDGRRRDVQRRLAAQRGPRVPGRRPRRVRDRSGRLPAAGRAAAAARAEHRALRAGVSGLPGRDPEHHRAREPQPERLHPRLRLRQRERLRRGEDEGTGMGAQKWMDW